MFDKMNKKQDGMVLVVTLMILLATTVVGMASLVIVNSDTKIAGNFRDNKIAFFAAEAGIQRSMKALRADLDWTDGFQDASMTNGSGYGVEVTPGLNSRLTLLADGSFGKAKRKVEVVINIDSVFLCALNAGRDINLIGKPRISQEGIRANENIYLELDNGTPPLNVKIPDMENVTLISDCYGEGAQGGELVHAMGACDVYVTEVPPLDFDAVTLELSEWREMASLAEGDFYFDNDGVFDSKDTNVTLNNFDCSSIPEDDNGQRTLFVDGDVIFNGQLQGICTVIATGKVMATGGFQTGNGTTVSMVAMDDVLINYDTNSQSFMNGLIYTEGSYELHGKIKYTGVVTAHGDISVQNPSEFTNNSDPNYWYTYSSAYSVIADPVDVLSWREIYE